MSPEQAKIRDYDGTMMYRWYAIVILKAGKQKRITTWAPNEVLATTKVLNRPDVQTVLLVGPSGPPNL